MLPTVHFPARSRKRLAKLLGIEWRCNAQETGIQYFIGFKNAPSIRSVAYLLIVGEETNSCVNATNLQPNRLIGEKVAGGRMRREPD